MNRPFIGGKRFRERFQSPLQNAEAECDRHAVIGKRNPLFAALQYPRNDLAPVERACASVDHQIISGKIFREVVPLHMLDHKIGRTASAQPVRELDRSDILADRVMGTGLCD